MGLYNVIALGQANKNIYRLLVVLGFEAITTLMDRVRVRARVRSMQ